MTDGKVAREVMGWRPLEPTMSRAYRDERGMVRTLELSSFGSFEPTKDMAAAWEVVEHLRPRFWTKIGVGLRIDTQEPLHEVAMGLYATADEPSQQLAYERGPDLPLAICRAALSAVSSAPAGRTPE